MWPDCVDHDYSSVTSKRLPISCGTKVRFRSFYVGTKIEIPVLVFPVEDHPKWTKISAEVAMKQSISVCVLLIATFCEALSAQVPAAIPSIGPEFEVATIKLSRPEERLSIVIKGRQFMTTASSVYDLATFAYGVHARQITNGPPWLETEKYDVIAQPGGDGQPNRQQVQVMVQKLLADRFRLAFHRDKKELSVFAIVVAKTGTKLNRSSDQNGTPGAGFNGPGRMIVKSATISDFAGFMQRYVMDRPVVDQTHITGKFDFTLNWTPNESQFEGRAFDPTTQTSDVPELFTAIQDQLGLKLESAKVPVEVLVMDHVEKPSDN